LLAKIEWKFMTSQKHIKEIQEYYDAFLASEPGKWSSLEDFKARYEPVLSFLQKISKENTRILDVGCGTGLAAEKLRTFGNVYGLDISPRSIKEAANRLDGVCTCLGEELPLKNAMSDVIVCTETIEHFISPVRALAEFNRVLEPNGYLILSTPNPWYWQILANRIIATLRRQRAGSGQVIENYISPIQLKAMLRRSGFEIKEFRTVYFKPGSLYKIVKKLSNGFGLYQICLARKARNICSKHAT
jgi:2-polyprenyl-3-methyl-5-hydroxy-6-metoxy-1,4-benzoquinol methylase